MTELRWAVPRGFPRAVSCSQDKIELSTSLVLEALDTESSSRPRRASSPISSVAKFATSRAADRARAAEKDVTSAGVFPHLCPGGVWLGLDRGVSSG